MLLSLSRSFVNPARLRGIRCFSDIGSRFEAAQVKLNTLTEDPGNSAKLKIYGLFKQANVGPCNIPKPGGFNFVAKAKYDVWKGLGDMTQDQAKEEYIAFVAELAGSEEPAPAAAPAGTVAGLDVTTEEGVLTIRLNRPDKLNALTGPMYTAIGDVLNAVAEDPSIKVAVLTGTGKWYSSGNDLSNFTKNMPPGGPQEMASTSQKILIDCCNAIIKFPKPLIAAVNGSAFGLPVTALGLCDLVYCTDNATFKTPFVSLGQSPEGCSSFTFPRILGFAKANEMLLTERQITAQEACDGGLVTRIFSEDRFRDEVDKVVKHMASLPPQSMRISKGLIRHELNEKLLEVNARECEILRERWVSDECMTAIMKFLNRNK
ncbi:enoyl-CoA delta isomerase 2-like [Bolinopsis microptera]|uniref:enoyl-CoA delta isomerase 2-like n=1 Tax=Bolinopsis microptera TaxID=2820187 RepID=UPI00307AC74E